MQEQAIDPKLLFVHFDARVAQTAALAILSLARCDSFEAFVAPPAKDETCEDALGRLFTDDDRGRRLLKHTGSGYFGSAIALALCMLFEHIPSSKRPVDLNGHAVDSASMAVTVLEVANKWLNQAMGMQPVEGPKRTPES